MVEVRAVERCLSDCKTSNGLSVRPLEEEFQKQRLLQFCHCSSAFDSAGAPTSRVSALNHFRQNLLTSSNKVQKRRGSLSTRTYAHIVTDLTLLLATDHKNICQQNSHDRIDLSNQRMIVTACLDT